MINKNLIKLSLIVFSGWIFVYSLPHTRHFFSSNTKEFYQNNAGSSQLGKHSTMFLGKRFCHPGYFGENCDVRKNPANPWYTIDCPNLEQEITYDPEMPLQLISNGRNCSGKPDSPLNSCGYLCFSHPEAGVAQIPLVLWKQYQQNEAAVWAGGNSGSDRGGEHLEGFGNYKDLPEFLGNHIEIGSGPYTQTQFIIKHKFDSISLLDPGADNYLKNVPGCKYKNGLLSDKPVRVLSMGAELLVNDKMFGKFDTVMSINVIEHVWDAFKFLSNIYNALKPGGILIYHDRFYPNPIYGDCVLGDNYHPIRLKREVFEVFFKKFKTIYMFEGLTRDQIKRQCGEVGFYFIGRKI